jgi:hypothetical protein
MAGVEIKPELAETSWRAKGPPIAGLELAGG